MRSNSCGASSTAATTSAAARSCRPSSPSVAAPSTRRSCRAAHPFHTVGLASRGFPSGFSINSAVLTVLLRVPHDRVLDRLGLGLELGLVFGWCGASLR